MTVIHNNRLWVKLTSCCNMGGPSISWRSEEQDLWGFPNIPRYCLSWKQLPLPRLQSSLGSYVSWKVSGDEKAPAWATSAGSSTLGSLEMSTWTAVQLLPLPGSDPLSPLYTTSHKSTCFQHIYITGWFLIFWYMKKKVAFFSPNEDDRHLGKVGKL